MKIKNGIVLVILILIATTLLTTSKATPVFNQKPIAEISLIPESEIYACQEIILDGSGSIDPDGRIISWQWEIQNSEKTVLLSGQKIILGKPFTSLVGWSKVTLTVTDNGRPAKSDTTTTAIRIKFNKAPKIERIEMSYPDKRVTRWLTKEEKFFLEAILTRESQDDPVNFHWKYDSSLFHFSDSTVSKPEVTVKSDDKPGTYKIEVTVIDTCGQKDSKEISLEIVRNSQPIAKISCPDLVNESEYFEVDGSPSTSGSGFNEAEDKIERFEWWWTKFDSDEILGSLWSTWWAKPWIKIADSGVYDIYLRVQDSRGGVNTTKKTVIVRETEDDPPIANASLTKRIAILGENFTLDGSASRDDREIEYYIWKIEFWFKSRYWQEEVWTKKAKINYQFERLGEHRITLTVRDTNFWVQENSVTFTVKVVQSNQKN